MFLRVFVGTLRRDAPRTWAFIVSRFVGAEASDESRPRVFRYFVSQSSQAEHARYTAYRRSSSPVARAKSQVVAARGPTI